MDNYQKLKEIIQQDGRKKYGKNHVRFKHGMSYKAIYFIWQSMRGRCSDKNNKSYKNYGARGITVCNRWLVFNNFYKDFGYKYKKGLSIERKDNNGNYDPKNCMWIPVGEQSKNRRNVKLYTSDGLTMTATAWEKKLNLKPDYILSKLRKGIPFEKIIIMKKYERAKI